MIVYLTHWFLYQDRAKAVAFFYAANPLSYVIGSPIAGLLLGMSWLGISGWRWLFVIEGIPAILLGFITIWYLTDWPSEARWLPEDEKRWITAELEREKQAKKSRHSFRIWEAVRHRDVLLLTGCYFCAMTGSYGIAFWLPTILKRLSGQSDLKVTLLSDETHKMLEAYGVWGKKSMYGRTFMGITRATFLIGSDGRIARIWPKVKVDGHAADVLAAAKALS